MDSRRGLGDVREQPGDPHSKHRPHISARMTAEARERLLTRELNHLFNNLSAPALHDMATNAAK